jgi:hypothetical protein
VRGGLAVGELSGGCSTHHGWNDKPGHGLGGTSRGIHAAWHTTARCVQPLGQWKPGGPCSGERSSDIPPRHLRASPVANLCATFSFNLVRSPRLRIDYPVISPSAPVSPADRPLAARIANTPPSPGNKEGFRQGLRVSGHVSVLIGHFFCAAVVQSASSWGQARLGAVTDASCRAAATNLGGEYRIGFSKKAKSLQKDRAVEEGERLRSGLVLAVPVLALCASELMMLSSLAGQRPALFRAARRDTNKPRRGLSLGEVAGYDAFTGAAPPSLQR